MNFRSIFRVTQAQAYQTSFCKLYGELPGLRNDPNLDATSKGLAILKP